MKSLLIETILKTHKITNYLRSKGINYEGSERNGKLYYKCPLHAGDNTPSFVVYTNSEYENYYCFGCKARYNIIHLYRDLEKVTLKQAIKALGNGMQLDDDAEFAHALQQIESDKSIQSQFTPDQIALVISRQIYDFLAITNKDPKCVEEVERIGVLVDKAVELCDFEGLHKLDEILQEVLPKRVQIYQQQQEQNILRGDTPL